MRAANSAPWPPLPRCSTCVPAKPKYAFGASIQTAAAAASSSPARARNAPARGGRHGFDHRSARRGQPVGLEDDLRPRGSRARVHVDDGQRRRDGRSGPRSNSIQPQPGSRPRSARKASRRDRRPATRPRRTSCRPSPRAPRPPMPRRLVADARRRGSSSASPAPVALGGRSRSPSRPRRRRRRAGMRRARSARGRSRRLLEALAPVPLEPEVAVPVRGGAVVGVLVVGVGARDVGPGGGDEGRLVHAVPDPVCPAPHRRAQGIEVTLDVVEHAVVDQGEPDRRAALDLVQRPLPRLEVDLGGGVGETRSGRVRSGPRRSRRCTASRPRAGSRPDAMRGPARGSTPGRPRVRPRRGRCPPVPERARPQLVEGVAVEPALASSRVGSTTCGAPTSRRAR